MNWSENKNRIYFIIIVVLIIIVFLQKCSNKPTPPTNITITKTDTVYAVSYKEVPTYIPKWKTKTEYIHDTTTVIDTAYVVGDYYSIYSYKDSLITDTLKLHINDSVCQNKIKNRSINYTLTYPIITTTTTVIQNKNEFYVGLGLVGSRTGINYFGPELLLRTKKKDVYGIGVGIDGNLKPNLSLRTYWKIGRK
jgi:hypothetical protein